MEDRRLFSAGAGAIALNLAPSATLSPSTKTSSHGNGGGGSGGGTGGGTFYPTASNVTELIADINYVDAAGGTFTVNLLPGTTFDLTTVNNTTNGANGLPVVGGAKAVNLTITGNGDTIERVSSTTVGHGNKNTVTSSVFRLFDVAQGAALTIDGLTLKNGSGGIYNQGTLTVRNNSTISGNSGGGLDNAGGTMAISDSTVFGNTNGGIQVSGGTVTISNSTVSDNGNYFGYGGGIYNAGGTVTISNSTLSHNADYYGGGIYNSFGNVTLSNNSTVSGNRAQYGGGIYNLGGTLNITDSTLSGNTAYQSDYPWTTGSGAGIYNTAGGTVTLSHGTVSGNSADQFFGYGGGIFNDSGSTVKLVNDSHIYGNTSSLADLDGNPINTGADVFNLGTLSVDSTSTIDALWPPAI